MKHIANHHGGRVRMTVKSLNPYPSRTVYFLYAGASPPDGTNACYVPKVGTLDRDNSAGRPESPVKAKIIYAVYNKQALEG